VVAQGRVWTGEQALPLKLVDSLGGLDEAMAAAKGLARLAPDQPVGIIELPEQPGLLQSLSSGKMSALFTQRPAAEDRRAGNPVDSGGAQRSRDFQRRILSGGADALSSEKKSCGKQSSAY